MPQSFGANMRQQREERAIALSTIVEKTKIKQSLLEAMERDDLSQWPNGFFRRAFVRAYAQAIGLEPDDVVREFLDFHADPADRASAISSLSAVEDVRVSGAPPTRIRQMVGSAVTRIRSGGHGPATAGEEGNAAQLRSMPRRAATVDAQDVPLGDVLAVANLCTKFGRARRSHDLAPLFQEAARIVDASGLIIWTWDEPAERLRPSWAHGYSAAVLSQLPAVPLEAENAVAAAFRSSRTSYVSGGESSCGAVVVPLLTAKGCVGVLAIELQQGSDRPCRVEALATIVAAQLARVIEEPIEPPEAPEAPIINNEATDREDQALVIAE